MGTTTELPGVTMDPKAEDELSQAFGVTSNAEELVRQNRARYPRELSRGLRKNVNDELSQRVQGRDEYDPERSQYGLAAGPVEQALEDHLGHPVETAVVRGSGRAAIISYTFIGDRGSIEKGTRAFTDVFSTDASRKAARRRSEEASPRQRAQAAADEELSTGDEEAKAKVAEAADAARKTLEDAAAKAQKLVEDAHAEAAQIREQAAADAVKAATSAEGAKKSGGGAKKASSSSKRSG